MNAPTTTPITAHVLSHEVLAIESRLLTNYLGDDLNNICQCAVITNDPVLIACSSHGLKKREDAVKNWRSRALEKERHRLLDFNVYFDNLKPEIRDSVNGGDVPLSEIDLDLYSFTRSKSQAKADKSNFWKQRLRESIEETVSLHQAEPVKFVGFPLPRFAAISADGASGFFRNRGDAVAWGRDRQVRFLLMAISMDGSGVNFPNGEEPDAETADDFLAEREFG